LIQKVFCANIKNDRKIRSIFTIKHADQANNPGREKMSKEITIRKPFDAHFHLTTDHNVLREVLSVSSRIFDGGVAIGVFNGNSVIDSPAKLLDHQKEIHELCPSFNAIIPIIVTEKLIHNTEKVISLLESGVRVFKFAPGKTCPNLNLHDMMRPDFFNFLKLIESYGACFSSNFRIEKEILFGDKDVDYEEQEVRAIRFLEYLLEHFPGLKILAENVSDAKMINFIHCVDSHFQIAGTLNFYNIRLGYDGSIDKGRRFVKPAIYAKSVSRRKEDVAAQIAAITSGDTRFFLGTNSCPLAQDDLTGRPPADRIFSTTTAIEGFAEIFENQRALEHMEGFTSINGPTFFGVEPSEKLLCLNKVPYHVPNKLGPINVFLGGTVLGWQIKANDQ
jgi:dihydroorotase